MQKTETYSNHPKAENWGLVKRIQRGLIEMIKQESQQEKNKSRAGAGPPLILQHVAQEYSEDLHTI